MHVYLFCRIISVILTLYVIFRCYNIFQYREEIAVSLRNGKLCLIFRINDSSCKHWIGTKISVFLLKDNLSAEGELQPNHIIELKIQPYGTIFWPADIVHEITSSSPLWDVSARDLMVLKFEILAVVTGSSILTGNSSSSQTSYLNKEILWGYRFSPCLEYSATRSQYVAQRKNFNKTLIHDTPLCSAKRLREIQKDMCKRKLSLDYTSSDLDGNNNAT